MGLITECKSDTVLCLELVFVTATVMALSSKT